MNYILGVDLGTSYFKAMVADKSGVCLGLGRVRTPAVYESGRCTTAPLDFWKALDTVIREACGKAGVKPGEISGISYGSQANSFILLDGERRPLVPLILWPDVRVVEPEAEVSEFWGLPNFNRVSGLGFHSTGLAVAKIAWIRKKTPGLWEKTRHIMSLPDYFVYGLTGERKGDAGTASLLGILDIEAGRWWNEALSLLRIDREMLSQPQLLCVFLGLTKGPSSSLPALPEGIPVFAGSLDHYTAAFGAGLGGLADMCDSSGTVFACVSRTRFYTPRKDICVGPAENKGEYLAIAYDDNGAAILEWFKDSFCPAMTMEAMLAEAAKIDSPPFFGPTHEAMKAGAVKIMESASEKRDEAVSGLLNSLAMVTRSLVDRLAAGKKPEAIVATGGGARSPEFLRMKADRIGLPFIVTAEREPAAYGAAMTAAAGLGWYDSLSEVSKAWSKKERVYEPGCEGL